MLPPRQKAYADRLRELIAEGDTVIKGATGRSSSGPYVETARSSDLHCWVTKAENVIRTVFGEKSAHFRNYEKFAYDGVQNHLQSVGEIVPIIGILRGALDDLEKGFLSKQEFLIAAALFDDFLEQAAHLLKNGHKIPAAMMGRVVLENALRRIAREMSIDDTARAAAINEELKKAERYPQPRWRQIQAWLDVGNAAAHGKVSDFTDADVQNMLEGIRSFLASEFGTA